MKKWIRRELFGLLRVLIISLGVFSCTSLRPRKIHREVKDYSKSFMREMGLKDYNLNGYIIGFSDMFVGQTIGVCFYGFRTIMLRESYWLKASELQKKALVYHELGHCVCSAGLPKHDDRLHIMEPRCPASIMHFSMPPEYCLEKYWNDYVDDLKETCNE